MYHVYDMDALSLPFWNLIAETYTFFVCVCVSVQYVPFVRQKLYYSLTNIQIQPDFMH